MLTQFCFVFFLILTLQSIQVSGEALCSLCSECRPEFSSQRVLLQEDSPGAAGSAPGHKPEKPRKGCFQEEQSVGTRGGAPGSQGWWPRSQRKLMEELTVITTGRGGPTRPNARVRGRGLGDAAKAKGRQPGPPTGDTRGEARLPRFPC